MIGDFRVWYGITMWAKAVVLDTAMVPYARSCVAINPKDAIERIQSQCFPCVGFSALLKGGFVIPYDDVVGGISW
jgi:hypothetical protein